MARQRLETGERRDSNALNSASTATPFRRQLAQPLPISTRIRLRRAPLKCDRLLAESDAKESGHRNQNRFNAEQIVAILKQQKAGMATAEACRRHGISSATLEKWKSKFGGLNVSEARRLRSLEKENSPSTKLLAAAMRDNAVLKDLASKNGRFPPARRSWWDALTRKNGAQKRTQ